MQTTFFESMLAGVPTVVLLKEELWNISETGKEIYNLLKKNKIIFEDVDRLIAHLNNINENPLLWWGSNELLVVREKFHDNFCNYKDNKKWDNFFLELD